MKKLFLSLIILSYLSLATPALAQTNYTLLQPLPLSGAGQTSETTTTAKNYIEGMFVLIIAAAGGLAVIKIIFGGIKYMSSDAIGGKSEAKETIQNAIGGLLLAVGAWLILNTISPNLLEFDLKIESTPVTSEGGGGG